MSKPFPYFGISNIKYFYWLTLFINGWFILPNWVFYFRQFITQTQVGLVEGIAVLIGIAMEVPSGVLADLLGKRNTLILGSLFQLISCLILINSTEFIHFLIGNSIMFIGFAFHSGATEALAYDSLKESNKAKKYPEVIGKSSSITIAATLISTVIGGYLYGLNPTYPFYAWVIFLAISVIILIFMKEPRVDTIRFNFYNYLAHLKEGTATLFNASLQPYLLPLFTFAIFVKLYQGIVRQSTAAYFGYTGETFGYLFAAISIPAIYASFKFAKLRIRFGDKRLITFSLFAFMLSFLVAASTNNPLIGATYYLVINCIENLVKPLTSSIINEHTDSKHRATTLSTLALFSQVPYIILTITFASITEVQNLPILFWVYVTIIAGVIFKRSLAKN